MKRLIFISFLFLMVFATISGNDSLSISGSLTPEANPPGTDEYLSSKEMEKRYNPWDDDEIILAFVALIFGLFVFGIIVFGVKSENLTNEYLQLLTLVLVICAAMFLIAAGYDSRQSAPAFGILGTIVGYLLGKQNNKTTNSKNAPDSFGNK